MSAESDGPDLSHVTEIPGEKLFQNAVNSFNKKAAGAAWNYFKRNLGTVTEPFFRKDMGERYYSPEIHVFGIACWSVGAMLMVWLGASAALGPAVCQASHFYRLEAILENRIFGVLAGISMAALQAVLGFQNLKLMFKYRNDGVAYYTRSRGVSRWGGFEIFAFLGMAGILLMVNLPVGAVFIAGYMMNSKLKSEQDAAIMSRYFDAMDAHVEQEYLHDAALGKCPAEITYLNKPLSNAFNPDVRKNIADALVGKPVSGLALHRNKRKTSQDGTRPGNPEPSPETSPTNPVEPAGAQPARRNRSEPRPPTSSQIQPEENGAPTRTPSEGTVEKKVGTLSALSNRKLRKAVIAISAMSLVAWGIVRFLPFHPSHTVAIESAPIVKNDQLPTNAEPPTIATATTRPQSPDPPPLVLPAPKVEDTTTAVDSNAVAQAALAAQKREETRKMASLEMDRNLEKIKKLNLDMQRSLERDKLLRQIESTLDEQTASLSKCKTDWLARLDANTNKIGEVTRSKRKSLLDENQSAREEMVLLLTKAEGRLNQFHTSLQSVLADSRSNPKTLSDEIADFVPKFEKVRRDIAAELANLDDEIAKAPKKSGFLNFK